jgi:hypothetical protein
MSIDILAPFANPDDHSQHNITSNIETNNIIGTLMELLYCLSTHHEVSAKASSKREKEENKIILY